MCLTRTTVWIHSLLLLACYAAVQSTSDLLDRASTVMASRLLLDDVIQANRHLLRISGAVQCAVPVARVVKVSTRHPDHLHAHLYPSSTILHECSDDTACCSIGGAAGSGGHHGQVLPPPDVTCVASEQELVQLYFHVYDERNVRSVLQLAFINHTACTCRSRAVYLEEVGVDQYDESDYEEEVDQNALD